MGRSPTMPGMHRVLLLALTLAWAADPVVLDAAGVQVAVHLPPVGGAEAWYRGSRFDPSSMVGQATWRGHTFLGGYTHPNFPETNTAVGLAEEFDGGAQALPPGLAGAAAGGTFLKLAVGAMAVDGVPYVSWRTRPVADRGTWRVERGADWLECTWDSPAVAGFACRLVRRLSLHADGLRIDRRLENRGERPMATEQYGHHFLSFDGRQLEAGYEIGFGWSPAAPATAPAPLRLSGPLLEIGSMPAEWKPTSAASLALVPPEGEDGARTITVRHRGLGLALRMVSDRTPTRIVVYAAPGVLCPEPFVALTAAPGASVAWSTDYTFLEER